MNFLPYAGILVRFFAAQATPFLPHVFCYRWNTRLVMLHVISDSLIFIAYSVIPFGLVYLARKRKDIPFNWMILSFGCFIIFCGLSHLMEIWTLWHPDYWLSGGVKALTALASVTTAVALFPVLPRVVALPTGSELAEANATLQARESSLRELTGRLHRIRDDERRRMARELHDSVGQELAGMKMLLSVALREPGQEEARNKRIEEAVGLCDKAIVEVRTMSYLLHPPLLDEMGLHAALRWYITGLNERSEVVTSLEIQGLDSERLDADTETALFRIVQESLTNVYKHSGSLTARVSLQRLESEVLLQIEDFGRGIQPTALRGQGKLSGVGLPGMNERVRQLGGTIHIDSNSKGTLVSVRLPVTITDRLPFPPIER